MEERRCSEEGSGDSSDAGEAVMGVKADEVVAKLRAPKNV